MRRKIDSCRAAGMRSCSDRDCSTRPAGCAALPDAVLRGSAGNLPAHGGLDLVFNAAVRDAASAYLGQPGLGPVAGQCRQRRHRRADRRQRHRRAGLPRPGRGRVGRDRSSGSRSSTRGTRSAGEDPDVADPGCPRTSGGPSAPRRRPEQASPTGAVSPLPGWVPGQREWRGAPVTSEQADAWLGWYTTSLIDTVAWQVGRLRELGFRGAVHVPVAGRGILPADRAAAVDGLLDGRADPDGALERGLDYPSQFPVLAGLHGVVVDFTGVDDVQAVAARGPAQDRCLRRRHRRAARAAPTRPPGRASAGRPRSPASATWRWWGRTPGRRTRRNGGDPASDSSAQQLQRAPDYARECGMTEFYWAFEDDLFTPGLRGGPDDLAGSHRRRGSRRMSAPLRVLHLGFEDPAMPGAGGGSLRTHEINRRLVADGMDVTRAHHALPRVRGPRAGRRRTTSTSARARAARGCRGCWATCSGCPRRSDGTSASSGADLVVEDFFAPFSSMAAPLWTRPPDDRGGAVAAGAGEEQAVPPAAAPAAALRRAQPPPARLGLARHRATSSAR